MPLSSTRCNPRSAANLQRKRLSALCLGALASFGSLPIARGQSSTDAVETAANALADSTVTVTAQRRQQTLLDVPASIIALGGDQLRDLGVTDFLALANYMPGVIAYNQLVGGRTIQTFTIRGIGNDDFRPNGSPSAAVHFDGVYQGSSALVGGQMFDVQRVEVLKGPQGTLYGRNSTAGAINIISRKPGDHFEGETHVDYGNYGSARVEAAVGGPIDDKWGIRIAGVYDRTDGYQTNVGPGAYGGTTTNPRIPANGNPAPDSKAAGTDFQGARAIITFAPLPDTKLMLNVHGFHEDGGQGQSERLLPTSQFAVNAPYTFDASITPKLDKNSAGASLTLEQVLPGDTLLTLIGGYEQVNQQYGLNDGQPNRLFDVTYRDHVAQQSVEARLQNATSGQGPDWVLGSMYYHDNIDMLSDLDTSDVFKSILHADYRQKRTSWAVFGDTTWPLSPQWSAGLGLRYTSESSDFDGSTVDLNPYGLSTAKAAFPRIPVAFDNHFNDSNLSGKGTLSYRPNAATTLYASVGRGFKAGGFDGSTIFSAPEANPFKSETVMAYETGIKFLPPRGLLQVDASLFFYDYRNLQANAALEAAPGVLTNVRTNVGKAQIYGGELQLIGRPTRALELSLGLSALHTEITSAESDNAVESARRLGNQLPNSPHLTLNLGLRYQFALNGLPLVASLNGRHVGRYYSEIDNYQAIGNFNVADARLEMRMSKKWTLATWVRNLADHHYVSGVATASATALTGFRAPPRTFGVSVNTKF